LKVLRKYFSEKRINYEIEAEFEYASCHLENKNYENSLHHFNHALELAEKEKNKKRSCEILVKIGECHKR
jgi:tetratricopeptide (TPR) repeat protein